MPKPGWAQTGIAHPHPAGMPSQQPAELQGAVPWDGSTPRALQALQEGVSDKGGHGWVLGRALRRALSRVLKRLLSRALGRVRRQGPKQGPKQGS